MRPNIDDKDLLIRCRCGSDHFLEVYDENYFDDGGLWLHVIDRPQSMWEAMKRWWRQRSILWADIGLSREDVVALRDKLTEWLEKSQASTTDLSE